MIFLCHVCKQRLLCRGGLLLWRGKCAEIGACVSGELALLLTLCMILGMVPTWAMAVDTAVSSDNDEAAALKAGNNVTVGME